jgi:hypothetical protein
MDRFIGAPKRLVITIMLVVFGAWDVILALWTIVLPQLWFRFFHGAALVDPQALLSRTGAVWLAFGVFQLYAWRVWEREPYWLAVVGGMRLSEVFADWTYLFRADNVTASGASSLLIATPLNLIIAWVLISTYAQIARGQVEAAKTAS